MSLKKLDRFRALTTHTSYRHDAFGMTNCIQRRQLDIWIDLEMISLFGGQELLFSNGVKEGEERKGKVSACGPCTATGTRSVLEIEHVFQW